MYTAFNYSTPDAGQLSIRRENVSLLSKFISWTDSQSELRLLWLGIALIAHASLLTPFTAMAIMLTSNSFSLVMIALSAMGLALVTNLAALPTRITIPAFFLSILIDIVIVAISFLAF